VSHELTYLAGDELQGDISDRWWITRWHIWQLMNHKVTYLTGDESSVERYMVYLLFFVPW